MEKEAKCTDSNKYNEVRLFGKVPEREMQLSFSQCSLKLRASTGANISGSKHEETRLVSKASLKRKRKRRSKNAHLKAIITESHLEVNVREKCPRLRKCFKNKKEERYNENLRDKHAAGKAVIQGQRSRRRIDEVSLRPKMLLKAWPSVCHNSKKDCFKATIKQNKLRNCRLLNKSITSHRCFDLASGSTVQACCLSSERGSWVSADPCGQAHVKRKRINPQVVHQEESKAAAPKPALVPSTSNKTSGHLELPGFYYDSDKKRYFKIVSSSNNCMSNVVTRERIAFDRNEKLRQEELQSLAGTGQLKDSRHQTTVKKATDILTLINHRKQGIVAQAFSAYLLRRFCIAKLRPHAGRGNRFSDSSGAIIQRMRINAKENQLLVCCSLEAGTLLNVTEIAGFRTVSNNSGIEVDRCISMDLRDQFSHMYHSCLVSDCCFATIDCASAILYCANNHVLNNSRIAIYQCTVDSPRNFDRLELLVNKQTEPYLMCCASASDFFAVGTECSVLLGNFAQPNAITQLYTSSTAIHALTFANTSSSVLFCAAKNGRILMYDERSSKRKPVAYLAESEGFSFDLYATKDDRYLLSAKSNGQKIENWDLRQGRVVVDYPGHISECARTPLVVDQREEFLSAVGSDSYTRIWDLKSGELMKILPPPLPATKKNIPSVCFVDLYGESRNNYPGLLLGMSNELHFYSL